MAQLTKDEKIKKEFSELRNAGLSHNEAVTRIKKESQGINATNASEAEEEFLLLTDIGFPHNEATTLVLKHVPEAEGTFGYTELFDPESFASQQGKVYE